MRSEAVPDLPEITSENFVSGPSRFTSLFTSAVSLLLGVMVVSVLVFQEERLSSDSVFVEFLNAFLLLPSFLEPIRYNSDRGVFEVGADAAESLSAQITALLSELKEKSTDPMWFPNKPLVDNSYIVSCLDQAQAMQWIRRERLPYFLQSDCYFEYRLASCLCQLASTKQKLFREESSCSPSATSPKHECATSLNMGHSDTRNDCSSPHIEHPTIISRPVEATKGKTKITQNLDVVEFEVSLPGQHLTQPGREQSPSCSPELSDQILDPTPVQMDIAEIQKEMEEERKICWELCQDAGQDPDQNQCPHLPSSKCKCAARKQCEIFPVSDKNAQTDLHTTACPHYATGGNCTLSLDPLTKPTPQASASTALSGLIQTPADMEDTAESKANTSVHGSRQVFLDFKSFLLGRPGEKILNLWMDMERLKTLHNLETRNRSVLRHLVWMKNQYLRSSSPTALSMEFLSRLDLTSPPCWTEDRLRLIQPNVTEVLLLYWGQRFIMSHLHTERRSTKFLWICWDCQLSLLGLDSCPRHPSPLLLHSACCFPSEASSAVRGIQITMGGSHCSEMERMVQALYVEPKAGFFFTHFCQNSGNQLWMNAAQFYRELQEYRQLFYQPTLDPYRVRHKAQLIYATYVCSAAGRNVGLGEQCRQHIFTHLIPPFEDLFDEAEEHILYLLLEPWTILTHQDMSTFHKVAVWEEERFVEPDLYKTLQSLYTQAQYRKQQCAQERRPPPPPPAKGAKDPDPWAQVPHQFRRYRLGTLLRNRMELQHFLAFLEENFASMDLLCWLDIEQLKRTPNDAAGWGEKCRNIRTQYLSRKYLFGPSSPANKQQQTELLRLAGGWARLQCEPLSMSVLSEGQSLVRSRIERKWLPLFLSTEEFFKRQKLQTDLEDVVEDQLFLRYKKKRQVWKQVNGGLMNSSQEVLALRRALLNPITCLHFRLFLSMRGELLENDLLFWLEVQRYKDLCHSHCDEATVQQKVSTIISCFIDSCIPPRVQIHLPPEQAQLILQNKNMLGPYIFREAQMCVFSELLKHWQAFVEFRSNMCEEQVVSELKKRRSAERERRMRRERDQQDDGTPVVLQGERGSVIEGLMEEASMYGGGEEDEETEEYERVNAAGQQLSWSYSKYLAALEREEILIRTQALQEEGADLSSVHSVRSKALTRCQPSSGKNALSPSRTHTPQRAPQHHSQGTESKQCDQQACDDT
ncbi:regulator of G-protein signaling 22 isoform X1 [Pygocentrus nattereri]|uniref:regulator of G-protein signaling 22 isoform X1 n=1 Tax=Pygocentrus nattereri TaxID=42514 RepID=UPI00189119F8|nr:regulator of G-protein signaling 22 isoform X1 [Pygocentrus nattereri]